MPAAIMKRRFFRTVASIACVAPLFVCGAKAQGPACTFQPGAEARVTAVRDGRTLVLDDGREWRLAGLETAGRGPEALRHLTEGQAMVLQAGSPTDRYGRLTGFAALPGANRTLQETLLDQGEALGKSVV